MTLRIPQADPMRRFRRYRAEIEAAVGRVLAGGHAVLGPEVEAFEAAFARLCGTREAVGVASGTDALCLALRAAGIGPGDEVLVPALTAAGTAQAVRLCGAMPVYVDADPASRCMDPAAAAAAIGPAVAAIVPVHLYGWPADIGALRALADAHGLALVEDCAQAHGATVGGRPVGAFGHAAAFSFYPTKNLGCLGDGGAVVTDDAALARRVRTLRNNGWRDARRISEEIAGPSRLDELHAAVLGALLPHLGEGNVERRRIARAYRDALAGGGVGLPPDAPGAVWHQFVIETEARDAVARRLAAAGIGTAVHYDPPLHLQPALAPARPTPLPVTERLCRRVLSLPVQPEVVGSDVGQIAAAIADAVAREAVR